MTQQRWKSIVVVVTDPFARKQSALSKAAAIARRCNARLTLFNSYMVPQPVNDVPMGAPDEIIRSATRQRLDHLKQLAAALKLRGARFAVEWDYPAHEAIVRQVLAVKPDLLITESHRHGKLSRLLLANTDWELIRTCPCPVWFVRSPALAARPQILVAVDPRHAHAKPARLDDRLVRAALTMTRQIGGRIHVVHAYETPASAMPSLLMEPIRLPISPERTREFVANTTRLVGRLCARYDLPATQCTVEEGAARNVVAAAARRLKSDVLVMGAVSRSRLMRPMIGSTAEAVIDDVDCDVLVVKPAGFKTAVKRAKVKSLTT